MEIEIREWGRHQVKYGEQNVRESWGGNGEEE